MSSGVSRKLAIVFVAAMVVVISACGSENEGSGSGETRTIRHAMDETEVPVDPSRVVALDGASTDAIVAVGIDPVGVTTFTGTNFEFYEYMESELEGVEIVGTFVEPRLESIAALEPDLIVGNILSHEDIYDNLSQIAPTVIMEDTSGDFRQYARNVGEVLNVEDEIEARIEEYEVDAGDVAERLGEAVGDESVALIRATADEYRLYGNGRLVGPILYGDLELGIPSYVEEVASDENFVVISLEEIPNLDAEHIFLLDQTDGEIEQLTGNPLWQTVPAVEAGNVYPARRDTWIAIGLIASEEMIGEIEDSLTQ